jgi:hypothetical protein
MTVCGALRRDAKTELGDILQAVSFFQENFGWDAQKEIGWPFRHMYNGIEGRFNSAWHWVNPVVRRDDVYTTVLTAEDVKADREKALVTFQMIFCYLVWDAMVTYQFLAADCTDPVLARGYIGYAFSLMNDRWEYDKRQEYDRGKRSAQRHQEFLAEQAQAEKEVAG